VRRHLRCHSNSADQRSRILVAAISPDGYSAKISYADLNIETETGAKVLYARLKWASAQVCGIESFTTVRSLSVRRNALNCFQETLEASVEKIDSDALTRAHSG